MWEGRNSSDSSWIELENQGEFLFLIYFLSNWRAGLLTFKVPPNSESLRSSCLVRWLPRENALLGKMEIEGIMLHKF